MLQSAAAAAVAAAYKPAVPLLNDGLAEPLELPEGIGAHPGAVPRSRGTSNEPSATALHDACKHNDIATAFALLHAGTPTSEQDDHGNIPLHYAVQNKCTLLIRQLLVNSSDPVEDKIRRNTEGKAPYHMLFEKPFIPLEYDNTEPTLLMTLALLIAATPEEANTLYLAAKNEPLATTPAVEPRSAHGVMPAPLHAHAFEQHVELIRKLLHSKMFSADTCDVRGYTVLMALANYPFFEEAHGKVAELIIAQIPAGSTASFLAISDDEGLTALHLAARINNVPCVIALLGAGADPLSSSKLLDMTPFGTSIRYGAFETFTVFLNYFRENGIAYDRPDSNGSLPSDELFFEPEERVFKDVRNDLRTLEYYLGKKVVL